ncbi:MAG: DinB family protein [Ruminiclostridium sp.]|nr:DinB family protein [Ruminiclostridium sp.]
MKIKAKELEELIEIFKKDYSDLDESLAEIKLTQDKWALKEIIGHLIDSASNNHQRFIRLQLSCDIEFPDYKCDEWLKIRTHRNMKFSDLLNLFICINKLMADIISNIHESSLQNKWHVAWDKNSSFITLEDLITHYISHIKSHLIHFQDRLDEIENGIR